MNLTIEGLFVPVITQHGVSMCVCVRIYLYICKYVYLINLIFAGLFSPRVAPH